MTDARYNEVYTQVKMGLGEFVKRQAAMAYLGYIFSVEDNIELAESFVEGMLCAMPDGDEVAFFYDEKEDDFILARIDEDGDLI